MRTQKTNLSWTLFLVLSIALAGCGSAKPVDTVSPSGQDERVKSGGADGGGGDIPQSLASEVKRSVRAAMIQNLPDAFYNLALGQSQVQDPYVMRVLQRFYNTSVGTEGWEKNQPVFEDILKTTYTFEETGGCEDNGGKQHAGGVISRTQGSKICFSIPLLKLIPKEDLDAQIFALAGHEVTHHFGFGELEAVKMQTYLLHHYKVLSHFPERFRIHLNPFVVTDPSGSGDQEVVFMGGEIIDPHKLDPRHRGEDLLCRFGIQYDAAEWEIRVKTGHFPDLKFKGGEIELTPLTSNFECSSDKPCITSWMSFNINPVFSGYYSSTGVELSTGSGTPSLTKLWSFSCSGRSLHLMDLLTIFGKYDGMPQVLN